MPSGGSANFPQCLTRQSSTFQNVFLFLCSSDSTCKKAYCIFCFVFSFVAAVRCDDHQKVEILHLSSASLFRSSTASNCCCRERRSAPKWYVSVFSIFLPNRHQSLRLSNPNNFAGRQCARTHRAASDMLLVTCKVALLLSFLGLHPPWCELLVVLQQRLLVASFCRTFLVG